MVTAAPAVAVTGRVGRVDSEANTIGIFAVVDRCTRQRLGEFGLCNDVEFAEALNEILRSLIVGNSEIPAVHTAVGSAYNRDTDRALISLFDVQNLEQLALCCGRYGDHILLRICRANALSPVAAHRHEGCLANHNLQVPLDWNVKSQTHISGATTPRQPARR